MKKKIFWILILSISGFLLYISYQNLIPALEINRKSHIELMNIGIIKSAIVVSKRKQIESIRGKKYEHKFVLLRYIIDDVAYESELPHQNASVWKDIKDGDVIQIKVHPQNPNHLYAPTFLEFQSEKLHPSNANYWFYKSLFLTCFILLGIGFVYLLKPEKSPTKSENSNHV